MPFLSQDVRPIPSKDITSWSFDNVTFDRDRPIYVDADNPARSYSHVQAKHVIRQLIAGLKAHGLERGDCVCIHSFNDINYPILVNAIVAAGCIWSGTNPSYTQHELAHAIKVAKISFVIVEPELLPAMLKAAEQSKIPTSRILIFDNGLPGQTIPSGFASWKVLFDHGESDWEAFDDQEKARHTTVARLFSSGTTGLPKAAQFSHVNFIAQHCMTMDWDPRSYDARALAPLPFFHVAIAPRVHFSPLRGGTQMFLMRRFVLEPYLANIQRHRITDLILVPPMVIAIVMSSLRHKYDLSSVRHALAGAAPMGAETQARFKGLLPKTTPFTQVWGMTETTCIASNFTRDEYDDTGSIGYFRPCLDVKLVDEEDRDITAYDVHGELCVRGPSVIQGYLDNPEANKSWDADRYFHTGDVMYCDGQTKKWYIVDRKKELIKVRGFQVAPPELETVLLEHPSIVDCAVIGVKDPKDESGELPRAYIVKRSGPDGDRLDEKSVSKHVKLRLAGYKQLKGGVVFVKEIPRNPSGKILKRVLREQAREEVKAKL